MIESTDYYFSENGRESILLNHRRNQLCTYISVANFSKFTGQDKPTVGNGGRYLDTLLLFQLKKAMFADFQPPGITHAIVVFTSNSVTVGMDSPIRDATSS